MSAAGFFLLLPPEDRDTRPMIKIGAILTRPAPALRELDMVFNRHLDVSSALKARRR